MRRTWKYFSERSAGAEGPGVSGVFRKPFAAGERLYEFGRARFSTTTASLIKARSTSRKLDRRKNAIWEQLSTIRSITAWRKSWRKAEGRKAILMFSDGEDNSSSHNMMTTIEAAQAENVIVLRDSLHGDQQARASELRGINMGSA